MQTTSQSKSNIANKKLYHTPVLTIFGNVAELTKTNSSGPSQGDGGTGGNNYNS